MTYTCELFRCFFDTDNDMGDDVVCFPRPPQIDTSAVRRVAQ